MSLPRHRWFAFTLRTLFLGLTVLGVCLGLLAMELRAVHKRAEMIVWCEANGGRAYMPPDPDPSVDPWSLCWPEPPPPKIRWIRKQLGDRGVFTIWFDNSAPPLERQRELSRLFPEAHLAWFDDEGDEHVFNDPNRAELH